MREFFGLLFFIILLFIWSWVFADGKANSSVISSNHDITIEKHVEEYGIN